MFLIVLLQGNYELGTDFQKYLRIRISTKLDFTMTDALENKINFYQFTL